MLLPVLKPFLGGYFMSAAAPISPSHAAAHLSLTATPEGQTRYNSYEPAPGAPEAGPDGKKGQDLNGPQLRAQQVLQQRVAVEDRPAQQAGFGSDTLWTWFDHASKGIEQFVLENPVIALVTMVVFGMFGISQILPTFLAAIFTGIPLCAYSFMVGKTIWQDHVQFSRALAQAVIKDVPAPAANGVAASAV
jgi:hypothetical protein